MKNNAAFTQIKTLLSRKAENPRLKEVYSQVLQDVARRVDKAFQTFFRRVKRGETPGYPKFKDGLGGRLCLAKIGTLKSSCGRRNFIDIGLGGRDIAQDLLAGYGLRMHLRKGTHLEWNGDLAEIGRIGVLATEVHTAKGIQVIPNYRLFQNIRNVKKS